MKKPHYISKEYASQYPELLRWDIIVSTGARGIAPEDMVEMLIDHAVEVPLESGICLSIFGVEGVGAKFLMFSRHQENLVIVITTTEADELLLK